MRGEISPAGRSATQPMKKVISVGLSTIASIIFILVVVFTMIGVVVNNETFINNEFTTLRIGEKMGIGNADLVRAMSRLVDYMEGDADDIRVTVTQNGEKVDMFSLEQENTHMQDVREIYLTIASYRDVGVLALLILFLFAAVADFHRAPQRLAQGYLSGAFVVLLIFGFLGTWAALDFSNFWTFFHEMLFWNDLWLFDMTESRMINMLPEEMFADIIKNVALYAGAVVALLIALSVFALVAASGGYQRRRAAMRARAKQIKAAKAARAKAREEAKAAAEAEKRLAERRARKAAAKARRAKQAEEAEKAAEKERLAAERNAARAAASAQAATAQTASAQAASRKAATPAEKPAERAKSVPQAGAKKKQRHGVADDTGFLDDDL